eukprot:scaffold293245_cov35-Tisochrysis_lutea.AAC.4
MRFNPPARSPCCRPPQSGDKEATAIAADLCAIWSERVRKVGHSAARQQHVARGHGRSTG